MASSNAGFLKVIALGAVVIVTIATRVSSVQGSQAQPHGRLAAQQVLSRAEKICRLIAPQTANLSLTAEPAAESERLRYWSVTGRDSSGETRLHFKWNSDTGDLCFITYEPSRQEAEAPGARMGKKEAVRAAWGWMRSLGIADKSPNWRMTRAVSRERGIWSVYWDANTGTALVSLDGHSGIITRVMSWPTRLPRQSAAL